MSLLGKGEQSQDALKATTSLMEMRAESREFYDAPMMTGKEKKKKEKKEKKQKLLMANESSSSSQHPEENEGHKQRQREMAPLIPEEAEIQQEMAFQKRKAVSLERSVATGGEERKKTMKLVFKLSPPSSSQQPPPPLPLPPPSEMASLTSSTAEDETEIWRTMALQKGLSEPDFYISKKVTTTDTKKNQNRYEISVKNMTNKMALQELAIRVNSKPEMKVVVMDKKGQEYQLFFRYIPSNGRYRFNGPEFTRFIEENNLQAGQIMRIYGLHDESGGNWGFAFINTDV